MKYLLLIYGNDEKWASVQAGDWAKIIADQDAWNAKYHATGELLGAYGLGSDATAKQVRRGADGLPAVTDGPYQETKEYIGSLYLLEVPDEARALEIAADMPWAGENPVEVWPVPHHPDWA